MSARATPPSEDELVEHAVRELSERTGFPVAFGGLIRDGVIVVTAVHGARTHALDGLRVHRDLGLGGKALVELRPRMTQNYGSSTVITHDYDRAVLGEGIATLLAVPVIVDGVARGVLYGGTWGVDPVGDVAAAPAFQVADRLAAELRVRDEVDRRVAMFAPVEAQVLAPLSGAHSEAIRSCYAELRRIRTSVDDSIARARIEDVELRLASLVGDAELVIEPLEVKLSPREIDVLACAALGGTTADIARQLGLQPGTVKAYLGSAMSKLGVSTRHAAVVRARRAGVLP